METLTQDLRFGVRMLAKNLSFSVIALLALTLGIGANTAIFSVVSAVLLEPLPYPEADRLVRLAEKSPQFESMSVAYLNFADWSDQSQSFEQMAIYQTDGYNLSSNEGAERIQGRRVSAGFLAVLRCKPALGRDFLPQDDQAVRLRW